MLTDSKKGGGNLSLMALFRNGPKLNLFALENFCYHVGVLSLYVGAVIVKHSAKRRNFRRKNKV